MLKIDREHLKKSIENIWCHLKANGRSTEEYRLYYNTETHEIEIHSNVGGNWLPGNYKELVGIATVERNVDLEVWFDIPTLRDEEGNSLGVWWNDEFGDMAFTEDDFYTECFKEYIRGLFRRIEDIEGFNKDEELERLYDTI